MQACGSLPQPHRVGRRVGDEFARAACSRSKSRRSNVAPSLARQRNIQASRQHGTTANRTTTPRQPEPVSRARRRGRDRSHCVWHARQKKRVFPSRQALAVQSSCDAVVLHREHRKYLSGGRRPGSSFGTSSRTASPRTTRTTVVSGVMSFPVCGDHASGTASPALPQMHHLWRRQRPQHVLRVVLQRLEQRSRRPSRRTAGLFPVEACTSTTAANCACDRPVDWRISWMSSLSTTSLRDGARSPRAISFICVMLSTSAEKSVLSAVAPCCVFSFATRRIACAVPPVVRACPRPSTPRDDARRRRVRAASPPSAPARA